MPDTDAPDGNATPPPTDGAGHWNTAAAGIAVGLSLAALVLSGVSVGIVMRHHPLPPPVTEYPLPEEPVDDLDDGQSPPIVSGEPATGPGEPGTRTNPLPPGVRFLIGPWEVTFEESDPDARRQLVEFDDGNQHSVEQLEAEGQRPVLVTVLLTYVGDGSGHPSELDFTFVAADANTHWARCGAVPDDPAGLGEMFTEAQHRANVCVAAPSEHIDGGVWMVEGPYLDWAEARQTGALRPRVFVALDNP